ncbi:MAG TPA: rhamnulokinase family protein [Candidatus Limnocylindrales bacterium]|nr:rhamnulokinase family protein [Candidatus Limnocylindrales bacterium]
MTAGLVAAVDLGASSGRIMVGRVAPNELELTEVHRFPNDPVRLPDGLHWDILNLYREILSGLRHANRVADGLVSIGLDSWGVDYGLLDGAGTLLGNPYHYRDGRTTHGVAAVHAVVPHARLYERNGLQFMPFNTAYQLAADRGAATFEAARTMLLTPDLLGYWLSGVRVEEVTIASTTGLLDAHRPTWDDELIAMLAFPRSLFAPLGAPGDVIGPLRDDVRHETGASAGTVLTLVGSHDTASAVVGVPATDASFAYIACGTWSLVGVELDHPILGEDSRLANFTNERGVDGRIRYLRNVMGLWLLQESLRTWALQGTPEALPALLLAAGELPGGGPVIDPDDPSFLPPGDMPARIAAACRRLDQPAPATRAALVRCILDSLATAYGHAVRDAARLSGRSVDVVHLVGGGANNSLLCQLTADACQVPVFAGPVEATALGNVLVQARAHGLLSGDLETLRALVRETQPIDRYDPRASRVPPATRARRRS